MIIRLAQLEDKENIANLIAQFRVELKRLKGIKSSINIEQAREEFIEYMEAKFPIFIAENTKKELLGYLVCRVDDGVVWVEAIYVSNNSRKKGIGSKLYDKAEEIANKLGGSTLYNWVHPNNDNIIPFLLKRGYNALNLIELRKPLKKEVLDKEISIGKYKYNY